MKVLVTGGAGYIGSVLVGRLLAEGHEVVAVDNFLFGGDAVLPFLRHPRFRIQRRDVSEDACDDLVSGAAVVVHLAALVGFPACRDAGPELAKRHNIEATKRVFEAAERGGVERFIFASTYSNYGIATDDMPVTEASPLQPQSLYAETKIEAERFLLAAGSGSRCAPVIPRFTTLFGVSARTRFDLIVNQFVLEALTKHRLVVYQGNYRRSFIHISDVATALLLLASAPLEIVRGEVFNVGDDRGNYTKTQVAELVADAVGGVEVETRDLSFADDMRDVAVSCAKIANLVGFHASVTLWEGICEVRDALSSGLIHDPHAPRFRNHAPFVLQ